jgi:hypothetical protein
MENQKANYKPPGHQLYVTRPGVLFKIFTQNKISRSKFGLVLRVCFFSILTWPLQLLQRIVYFFKVRKVSFEGKEPVFVLGHWRSGTTHIHYLLSKDPQFGFLSNFQSFFFNISSFGYGWLDRLLSPHTVQVRPQDNMDFTVMAPQEEEQVVSNISDSASVHSFYFPHNQQYFDKFNLFEGIKEKELKNWKRAYLYVLKGITNMAKGKRLIIKNPNNTGRIQQLLALFPNAKFVYIHRNPFSVYLSTLHLYRVVLNDQSFQDIDLKMNQDMIINNYKKIQQAYLRDRHLIPEGNLVEVSYDQIGEGSLDMFKEIYQKLGLKTLDEALPKVKTYLSTIKNYKKNKFIPIEEEMVARIQKEWKFAFDEFGYENSYKDTSQQAAPTNDSKTL